MLSTKSSATSRFLLICKTITSVQSVKKNKTITRYFALASHSRTHLPSFFFSFSLLSARTTLGGTLLLLSLHLASRISYLARCFSRALYLWLACIHYMHALHLVSTTYMLPYCTCTAHLVLRGSMHTLHDTCYSVLCTCTAYFQAEPALPWSCNVCSTSVACHACYALTLQLSRTGYESESPTNSGVIEDTGDSIYDGYCVRYEEGRGGIQKCCVCWKG